MSETPFIITIDTEGDDLWSRPREITTRNAEYLPRFQGLCERFGFKPVYLTNYEMAMSDLFVEFARDMLARDAGEIGMHLHAWNSPPLVPLTGDDFHFQPYLIEYPELVMERKIKTLTRLLEDRFGQEIISHRAGRWAFDGRYAAILLDEGYRVDCSVTPGVDWRGVPGDPCGNGGIDYTAFPGRPYFLNASDISIAATGSLLEVPVTIRPAPIESPGRAMKEKIKTFARSLLRSAPWANCMPLLRWGTNRALPALSWLYPSGNNLDAMLRVSRAAQAEGAAHMEFILHSSELMPGGSPTFRNASDIERLYEHLEILFEDISAWCRGATLRELHARLGKPRNPASQAPAVTPDPAW